MMPITALLHRPFLYLLLACLPLASTAQESDDLKDPAFNFGIQAGVITPSALFRVRNTVREAEGMRYQIDPSTGFQVGGLATFRLSKRFQLQGGLTLLLRNYDCSATYEEQTLRARLNTTLYEIPLLITYYQRMSERLLLSLGTGVNLQTLPSDLGTREQHLQVLALHKAFVLPASLTVLGLEFRAKNRGGFFVGLSYCITPFHLYDTVFLSKFDGRERVYSAPHVGDYFGLVARYYLD
ncbi:MAG: outer membrane beta-barrel protein [Saprospiraceae bacterium]|nr:outer membrane beta-barrel protein [Saprospiraceae bacterium]MDW8230552.1 outer membrane beta-barrel protein [Saprospiraceae bacterium]